MRAPGRYRVARRDPPRRTCQYDIERVHGNDRRLYGTTAAPRHRPAPRPSLFRKGIQYCFAPAHSPGQPLSDTSASPRHSPVVYLVLAHSTVQDCSAPVHILYRQPLHTTATLQRNPAPHPRPGGTCCRSRLTLQYSLGPRPAGTSASLRHSHALSPSRFQISAQYRLAPPRFLDRLLSETIGSLPCSALPA